MLAAPPRAATRWRLIRDEPRPGAWNMALDHALATCLDPGEGVVRLYAWSAPTVSFGKNEPATRVGGDTEPDYVRRPTGGRAVLHDRELTYAVVAPLGALGGLREAYRRINEALAGAILALGAEVELARGGAGRTLPPDAGPCFRAPATGEIVAAGRKLVGSAQARLEGALLQHGAILLENDQGALGVATAPHRLPDAHTGPVTLRDLLGSVDVAAVEAAVATSMRLALAGRDGGAWDETGYEPRELAVAERLVRERYGRDGWTWRRRQERA